MASDRVQADAVYHPNPRYGAGITDLSYLVGRPQLDAGMAIAWSEGVVLPSRSAAAHAGTCVDRGDA